MQISEEAVEAAAKALWGHGEMPEFCWDQLDRVSKKVSLDEARAALEAAAPHMLSHEREETRLAHLDAMVNRETKRNELAAAWDEGWFAEGRQTNPYRSQA